VFLCPRQWRWAVSQAPARGFGLSKILLNATCTPLVGIQSNFTTMFGLMQSCAWKQELAVTKVMALLSRCLVGAFITSPSVIFCMIFFIAQFKLTTITYQIHVQWTRQFRVIDSSGSPSHKHLCVSRMSKYTDL